MSSKKPNFFEETLRSESGIALIMVLGVITILTLLLADFTFETKLNKIKVYNQQDKIQARLNAESGLNFAVAKLRLYQEGRNKIEKDENIKSAFPVSDLEEVIIQPFVFPLPTSAKANIIQRTAIEEFMKKTLFRGELSVTISKVSGLLNPNGLRLKVKAPTVPTEIDKSLAEEEPEDEATTDNPDEAPAEGENKKTDKPEIIIEKKFVETIQRLMKDKSDLDEEFHEKYSNLDPAYLVKELKFYVNDAASFKDQERPEIEAKFSQKNIKPKHGPMASIDELYLLPSWDDAIVDLIKDRMSVHEVNAISINELTVEDLKIIFPAINNIQIEEFFKYRDGDPDKKIKPNKFKNAENFKAVVVSTLNIVSDSEYEERIADLKQAGLTIETAGKLYKVNSRGVYNNAIYNLVAYVDLPIKPQPPKKKKPKVPGSEAPPADDQVPQVPDAPGGKKEEEKPEPLELLVPRVIELRLE